MIIAKISDWYRYENVVPQLKTLFKFVTENDLTKFSSRIVLDGDDLFINMAEPTLKKADEQKLEVHREYIDVHIPLTGPETIGITSLSDLTVESDEPFNEDDDYAVYSEPARNYITLHPGEFCLVFPEDAHAPIIGEGTIKKAIAKIRIYDYYPF